jgi:hypothetical protein
VASATMNPRFPREPPLSLPVDPWCRKVSGVMLLAVSSPWVRQAKLQALGRWNGSERRLARPGPGKWLHRQHDFDVGYLVWYLSSS